jgi:hypothetical protein
MFNKDFYPTPDHVIDMMGIECHGKVVLEPSAGKGNIVDWLKSNGAAEVLVCEKHPELAIIAKAKGKFIADDFLSVTPEQISHIDMIVMNPPFSADERHILHAWEIAPGGCEIIALCNYETLRHSWSSERRQLKATIESHGYSDSLGECFSASERTTGVEVGLVRLFKPKTGANEFEGFFMDEDEELPNGNGIMPFNSIRDIVQRYVYAVKLFDEFEDVSQRMNSLTSIFGLDGFKYQMGYNEEVTTKDDFKKKLQIRAWKYLFAEMKLTKYVTYGVMKDINSFVEKQTHVPFTMKNIYRMFQIIVGTRDQIFDRALVEAVDKFTEHTHENRYGVEGWKTNAGHLLNKKIIVGWCFEYAWYKYLSPRHGGNFDRVEDLNKVLCSLTGTNYDSIGTLYSFCQSAKMQPNEWNDWGFFRVKGFKKGTLHMQFKSEDVWALLNQRYAKIKGAVLPEKF